jgi:hypothetical protein
MPQEGALIARRQDGFGGSHGLPKLSA